jgi:hypothetical protein
MSGDWTHHDDGARRLWERVVFLNVMEALGIRTYSSGTEFRKNSELSTDMSKSMIEDERAWFKAICDFAGLDWRYVKRMYNKAKNDPNLIDHTGFVRLFGEVI